LTGVREYGKKYLYALNNNIMNTRINEIEGSLQNYEENPQVEIKSSPSALKSILKKTGIGVAMIVSLLGCKSMNNTQKCLGKSKGGDITSSIKTAKKECKRAVEASKDHPSSNDAQDIAYTDCRDWRNEISSARNALVSKKDEHIKDREFDDADSCKAAISEMDQEGVNASVISNRQD
jgi:hypothetical protein